MKIDPQAIAKLEDVDLFVYEKSEMLLVAAGLKRATNVFPKEELVDEILKIVDLLHLEYQAAKQTDGSPIIHVASNKSDLGELIRIWDDPSGYPKDHAKFGELSGIPPTAIQAYLSHTALFVSKELPDLKREEYYPFLQFKVSPDHWRDEVKVAEQWADEIKRLSSKIYEGVVNAI